MEPLKIGLVGLGSRGYMLLKETLLYIPEMQISVVCDACLLYTSPSPRDS